MRSRSEGCAASCGAGSAAGDAGLQPVVGDLEGLDEIVLPRLDREPPERCRAVEPEDRGACPQVAQLDTAGDVRGDGGRSAKTAIVSRTGCVPGWLVGLSQSTMTVKPSTRESVTSSAR